MLGNRKLVLDTFCEVYDLIKHLENDHFWEFDQHQVIPGALYIIGSQQFFKHKERIIPLIEQNVIQAALSNPAEGSATIKWKVHRLGIFDLIKQGKMFIISGGDIEPEYSALVYDAFLPKILDYTENLQAIDQGNKIHTTYNKPYKFLFLNGRARYHRKYLLEIFQQTGLLKQALWTNLDISRLDPRQSVWNSSETFPPVPINFLPPEYEVERYRRSLITTSTALSSNNREENTVGNLFIKQALFNNDWGEIYLQPKPYIDTYFSLVTETVFDYPYSFRTEKIWKPIAMGHPWIAVANQGYYRDLHNLGFKTFGHVIDESFDMIEDNQLRIERIVQVVEDLCQQNLAKFLDECYDVCKYNQQHLAEMRLRVRQEFPDRFSQFLNDKIKQR